MTTTTDALSSLIDRLSTNSKFDQPNSLHIRGDRSPKIFRHTLLRVPTWRADPGPIRTRGFVATRSIALVQSFGGSSPSDLQRVSNNCEYVRTVCAQIGSFREVLSKRPAFRVANCAARRPVARAAISAPWSRAKLRWAGGQLTTRVAKAGSAHGVRGTVPWPSIRRVPCPRRARLIDREGFAPPAATCPRHAQCPSHECAAALYVERLIDRLGSASLDPRARPQDSRSEDGARSAQDSRPWPIACAAAAHADDRSRRRVAPRSPFHPVPRSDPQADPAHSAAAPHSLPAWLASAFWRIDQYATAPSLLGSPGHRFGSPRCAAPRGRSSTVLAPAGKQYDVCLLPGRAEEQSPHVPRKTGNVLTAAWPIAINVMVACRPTSGTTSSLPEGIHRHLGPRPRSNAPSQSLPRTEQAPHAVPSPVDLANATCSVQTDPTAVCVPS